MKHVVSLVSLMFVFTLAAAPYATAHCDTLDGPVVSAARQALASGDVTPVLKWIRPEQEPEIRDLFTRTLKVRGLSPDARQLSDAYFFETLVRVHRAGEGVAYTGLKPAGEVEPGIAAADAALASGNIDDLVADSSRELARALRQRFAGVLQARRHADESVAAGREYVAAYVSFIHFVESLHQTVSLADNHTPEHQHQ